MTNLPEEQCSDYGALCAALENRFGNTRQVELNRAHLRSRTIKREESLPELAEDVHGTIDPTDIFRCSETEDRRKDQYIDALPEEDMQL